MIAAVRVTRAGGRTRARAPRPITAEQAASIDHRTSNAHAPAKPEPVLNRVHGQQRRERGDGERRADDAVDGRPQSAATGAVRAPPGCRRRGTSDRHSGPSTRPRTGTAHSTQSGRPHTSHLPTVSRDGCVAHRSAPLVVRSSVGIVEAYAPVIGRSDRVVASEPMEARIAVLVSGSGTNLQALLDDPVVRPYIALVLSDRPGVFSLDRARDAGVESAVIEPDGFPDRSDFDLAVLALLEERGIDTLVSAGLHAPAGQADPRRATEDAGSTCTRRCCRRSRGCTACATRSRTASR